MENYKLILLGYSLLSFIIYLSMIVSKYGVLSSISDIYYEIKNKYTFTLFIWSIALPIAITAETGLMFFGAAFICFVGAAPAFKEKLESKIHKMGALGGVLLIILSLSIDYHLYYPSIAIVLFTLIAIKKRIKNKAW